jgi:ribosomal protein S18 acetylase RimI-like enzyme
MEVRPFVEGDGPAVAALWDEVFGYQGAHNAPDAVIRQKVESEDGLFFVAAADGRVVGTAMGGYDGHRGWIYTVAVATGLRRRGVGTALVRRVEEELAARGCPKVNLQVRAENAAVVAFYERLGYRVEPRVSMGKLLPP